MLTLEDYVKIKLDGLNRDIERFQKRKEVVIYMAEELKKLSFLPDWEVFMFVDFDNLTHEQVIEVIQKFPGKWDKEYVISFVNYIRQEEIYPGYKLRLYSGGLPPSCKVVDVGEEFVPGYVRRKLKIVCNEDNTAKPEGLVSDATTDIKI